MTRLFRAALRKGQWDRVLGYSSHVSRPHPLLSSLAACIIIGVACLAYRGLQATASVSDYADHRLARHLLSSSSSGGANLTYYNGKCEIIQHTPKTSVSLEACDTELASGAPGGFIALYTFLTIVTFIAVAIVCDDFFVPSLEAISEKLHLSEDVAGATFMAAGSSAPELFSSMSAVAMDSDAGVGTIAGSAVFNILIIVSFSAAFAGKILELDWRPLARDSVWYLISIIYFIIMVMDSLTQIWEAVILLVLYALYILTMVFNQRLMIKLAELQDRFCSRGGPKVEPVDMESQMQPVVASEELPQPERAREMPSESSSSLRSHREPRVFKHDRRNSLLLSLHGSKPSLRGDSDGDQRRKSLTTGSAAQLKESTATAAAAAGIAQTDSGVPSSCHNSAATLSESDLRHLHGDDRRHRLSADTTGPDSPSTGISLLASPPDKGQIATIQEESQRDAAIEPPAAADSQTDPSGEAGKDEDDDEVARMSCCCSCCPDIRGAPPQKTPDMTCGQWAIFVLKWVVFVLAFPFILAYSMTIPDCSKPHLKKYFLVSFFISVLWIAGISFAMVTVVARLGCLLGIDTFVMAITVLAAGTSIPDLLSSIIVARDGFADMAVSNAIGSNVFDIDVGLGLPFFVRLLINKAEPLDVFSEDERRNYCQGKMRLIVHVKFGIILIIVLFITLGVMGVARLRIGKVISVILFSLYILFLIYAFVQQFSCPNVC